MYSIYVLCEVYQIIIISLTNSSLQSHQKQQQTDSTAENHCGVACVSKITALEVLHYQEYNTFLHTLSLKLVFFCILDLIHTSSLQIWRSVFRRFPT
jgi:hypothetical protein